MSNKYKLLRDLPDAQKGTIYVINKNGDMYTPAGEVSRSWSKERVESYSDWWEEVNDRIEVIRYWYERDIDGGGAVWSLSTNKQFQADKFPAIRQAIERVLNGDDEIVGYKTGKKVEATYNKSTGVITFHDTYTQEELDKAMESAFNAARMIKPLEFNNQVFPTFQDYLTSINNTTTG